MTNYLFVAFIALFIACFLYSSGNPLPDVNRAIEFDNGGENDSRFNYNKPLEIATNKNKSEDEMKSVFFNLAVEYPKGFSLNYEEVQNRSIENKTRVFLASDDGIFAPISQVKENKEEHFSSSEISSDKEKISSGTHSVNNRSIFFNETQSPPQEIIFDSPSSSAPELLSPTIIDDSNSSQELSNMTGLQDEGSVNASLNFQNELNSSGNSSNSTETDFSLNERAGTGVNGYLRGGNRNFHISNPSYINCPGPCDVRDLSGGCYPDLLCLIHQHQF